MPAGVSFTFVTRQPTAFPHRTHRYRTAPENKHSHPAFLRTRQPEAHRPSFRLRASDSTNSLGTPQKVGVGLLLIAAGTAVAIFFTQGWSLKEAADYVSRTIDAYGPWGPVIFVATFVVATLLLIPATGLTLAAGFLFGPVAGTALVTLAATLGAAAAFLVSRYIAKDYIKGKLQSYPRLKAIEEQVSTEGFKIVLLLRLAPLVPFTILNYALGVSEVSFVPYIVATALGKLFGVFSQVYVGSTGRSVEAATTATGSNNINLALTAVGVVASIVVTKVIADKASGVLKQYDSDLGSSTDKT